MGLELQKESNLHLSLSQLKVKNTAMLWRLVVVGLMVVMKPELSGVCFITEILMIIGGMFSLVFQLGQ